MTLLDELKRLEKAATCRERGLIERMELRTIMEKHAKHLIAAVEALEAIAAYNDESANNYLQKTGSYSAFYEPNAVQTAREALRPFKEPK